MYETVVFECIWRDCNDIGFACNMIADVFADLLSENEMKLRRRMRMKIKTRKI